MELARMLSQMCQETLADADISAIRKARGFSQKETASRPAFESFFVSSVGLENVMETLSDEEVATLHLLNHQGEEVDITFFERLYGSAKREQAYYHGTFTQQYRPIYDQVKQNLVRKGLLVVVEAKLRGESTQMERWRYRFPVEFSSYLPPLVRRPRRSSMQGQVNRKLIAAKLLEIAGGPAVAGSLPGFEFSLKKGTLFLGNQPFEGKQIPAWQEAGWQSGIQATLANDKSGLPPEKAIPFILKTLQPDEWLTDSQIASLLEVFCFGARLPAIAKILQTGWEWGLLERLTENELTYYRLPSAVPETATPDQYLTPDPAGESVLVDLRSISLTGLETLNALVRLEIRYNNLIAFPDLIKLGRARIEARHSSPAAWLCEHVPAIAKVAADVEKKWGQNLVHLNLCVARVRDLSLRVQLERDLKGYLLVLSEQFVAFPVEYTSDVEKSVKKAGFVIKVVRP